MTYYCRRNDKDGRLECEVAFHFAEARLFRKGTEAYLLMICQEPEAQLRKAGAVEPFEYRCYFTGTGMIYMLTVGELG